MHHRLRREHQITAAARYGLMAERLRRVADLGDGTQHDIFDFAPAAGAAVQPFARSGESSRMAASSTSAATMGRTRINTPSAGVCVQHS